MNNGIITVEDTGNLLERRALGLDVEEEDPCQLAKIPGGVKQREVPVVWEIIPGQLVGLTRANVSVSRVTSFEVNNNKNK